MYIIMQWSEGCRAAVLFWRSDAATPLALDS